MVLWGIIGYKLGLCWDNGQENGNYYIIIERTFWIYCETSKENGNYYTITECTFELYWNNGKENGNYYILVEYTLGLYWKNGKEKGNCYAINVIHWGCVGIMKKRMETTTL